MEYVLGFAFDKDAHRVVLILKDRPRWQAGKVNGVGGKMKTFEHFDAAMSREFYEETGVTIRPDKWDMFARMHDSGHVIYCYRTFTNDIDACRTMESERVIIVSVCDIPMDPNRSDYPFLENVPALISLAKIKNLGFTELRYKHTAAMIEEEARLRSQQNEVELRSLLPQLDFVFKPPVENPLSYINEFIKKNGNQQP